MMAGPVRVQRVTSVMGRGVVVRVDVYKRSPHSRGLQRNHERKSGQRPHVGTILSDRPLPVKART